MKVYFIRHGETEWNSSGRWQGWVDTNLSDSGRSQAIQVSGKLKEKDRRRIYSSDVRRALETARIISKELGNIPIVVDSRLRERSLGEIEGKTTNEVSGMLSQEVNIIDIIGKDLPINGMELLSQQFERAESFLRELRLENEKDVIVVSHGVMIGVMMETITGEDFRFRKIGNCEVIPMEISTERN